MTQRVDTRLQRAHLPVGCFDHYDTLILWHLTVECVAYDKRGNAGVVRTLSYREFEDVTGLSTTSSWKRLKRLATVGLVRMTPKGASPTLKEVPIAWPMDEYASSSM